MTGPIEPHRTYKTSEVAEILGKDVDGVRAMIAAGEFGEGGAIVIRTSGPAQRIHAYRVFGWAVRAWIKRNAVRAA